MIINGDCIEVMRGMESLPDNIKNKIRVDIETGCWEWTGSHNGKGYGEIRIKNKKKYAHRVVYEILVGAIPEGEEIDHLCRNRCCCNPDHLETVTHKENVNRGLAAEKKPELMKEYCINGHLYSENTYIRNDGKGRNCIQCVRDRSREYQRRKRKERLDNETN